MKVNKRYLIAGLILAVPLVCMVPLLRGLQRGWEDSPLEESKIKGPMNAPIIIQEFSDFQCPACKKATEVMHRMDEKYPYKMRINFFHFPLPMHKWAALAHQCAECAHDQGAFWRYHDVLYERQDTWSKLQDVKEVFISYARELKLDLALFKACLSQDRTRLKILDDVKKGKETQVNSTPTFFVNGRRIVGGKTFEVDVEKIIQEELNK